MLQRTLDSLYRSACAAKAAGCLREITVFLINNTPDLDYREQVQQRVARWPHQQDCPLRYSEAAENLGFGAGNNSVLPLLDEAYHLILNPDVELFEDTLLCGLRRLESDPEIVLLSPRVSAADGRQEFLCKRHPSLLVLLLRGFAPRSVRARFRARLDTYEMRDQCSKDALCDVPLASGCFMLLRTDALQRVGGFSEDYFLYFEDFDLSVRLGHQGRVVFDPGVRIVHHGGYAAHKGWRHRWLFIRSAIHFFQDHGWRWI